MDETNQAEPWDSPAASWEWNQDEERARGRRGGVRAPCDGFTGCFLPAGQRGWLRLDQGSKQRIKGLCLTRELIGLGFIIGESVASVSDVPGGSVQLGQPGASGWCHHPHHHLHHHHSFDLLFPLQSVPLACSFPRQRCSGERQTYSYQPLLDVRTESSPETSVSFKTTFALAAAVELSTIWPTECSWRRISSI